MFHQTIDVAKIMNEIKASIVPEEKIEIVGNKDNEINKKIIEIHNEMNRINTYIKGARYKAEANLNVGSNIPQFMSFSPWKRKILIPLQKIVQKAILFMTREQAHVNIVFNDCIRAISEYNELNKELLELISIQAKENEILKKQIRECKVEIDNLNKRNGTK